MKPSKDMKLDGAHPRQIIPGADEPHVRFQALLDRRAVLYLFAETWQDAGRIAEELTDPSYPDNVDTIKYNAIGGGHYYISRDVADQHIPFVPEPGAQEKYEIGK
jgi:hypothetical protein